MPFFLRLWKWHVIPHPPSQTLHFTRARLAPIPQGTQKFLHVHIRPYRRDTTLHVRTPEVLYFPHELVQTASSCQLLRRGRTEVSGWLYQHIPQERLGAGTENGVTNFRKKPTKKTPNPKCGTSLISLSCNAIVFCESANQERITHMKHGYKHSWLSGYLGTWNNFLCVCWAEKTALLNFAF